jgi:hypothetical protein
VAPCLNDSRPRVKVVIPDLDGVRSLDRSIALEQRRAEFPDFCDVLGSCRAYCTLPRRGILRPLSVQSDQQKADQLQRI